MYRVCVKLTVFFKWRRRLKACLFRNLQGWNVVAINQVTMQLIVQMWRSHLASCWFHDQSSVLYCQWKWHICVLYFLFLGFCVVTFYRMVHVIYLHFHSKRSRKKWRHPASFIGRWYILLTLFVLNKADGLWVKRLQTQPRPTNGVCHRPSHSGSPIITLSRVIFFNICIVLLFISMN